MATSKNSVTMKESYPVTFRASLHLVAQLERMSKETGVPVSSLVRMCTTQALPKVVSQIFEAYKKNPAMVPEGLNVKETKVHKNLSSAKATS